MKTRFLALAVLLIGAAIAPAQERLRLFQRPSNCVPCPPPVMVVPGTEAPRPSDGSTPPSSDAAQPPSTSSFNEALASAGESGTQPASSLMPGFFGDVLPSTILTQVHIPEQVKTTFINSVDASQSAPIKLAESDSPRPINRLYYNYNLFGSIKVDAIDPTVPNMTLHRHVIGVEKTLFGQDASIGLRLPFFSLGGGSTAYDTGWVGDLTILTKYALINNRQTGNVFSVGLAVTAPTGGAPNLEVAPGQRAEQQRYFAVNMQPYFGYIYNLGRIYAQGFHGVVVPTDSNLPTFMSNSLGLGAFLFRDPRAQFIQAVVPTFEVHVNTPFNHRTFATGAAGETRMLDSVNLTMGGYVMLPRSTVGGAVGVPVAYGPQRIEALATYTLRY